MRSTNIRRRNTRTLTRKQRQDRMGMLMIALSLSGFCGMFYGAYKADQARGITVCESLAQSGFGNIHNC